MLVAVGWARQSEPDGHPCVAVLQREVDGRIGRPGKATGQGDIALEDDDAVAGLPSQHGYAGDETDCGEGVGWTIGLAGKLKGTIVIHGDSIAVGSLIGSGDGSVVLSVT